MATRLRRLSRRGWLTWCLLGSVAVIVASVAWYWYGKHHTAVEAREAYQNALAKYEAQMVPAEDVCSASAELCRAEEEVPFADPVRALALHAVRLCKLESKMRAAIPVTLFGEDGRAAAENELNRVTAIRIEAQEKLDEWRGLNDLAGCGHFLLIRHCRTCIVPP